MMRTLQHIIASFGTHQRTEYVEGVAIVLFETVKGPKQTFHSKMSIIIQTLVALLKSTPADTQGMSVEIT